MMQYTLQRSKRKSVSIIIKNGSVIVKAPQKCNIALIEQFLAKKQGWIDKKLSVYKQNFDKFSKLLEYKEFCFYGNTLTECITNKVKKMSIDGNKLLIPQKYANTVVQPVKRFYIKTAQQYLKTRLEHICSLTGFKYSSFKLTNARTKWGSCTSNNDIRLNWRLVMLEPRLIDYVVLHELCHTQHHNHSKEYWELMKSIMPDIILLRKNLKNYSLYMQLFR